MMRKINVYERYHVNPQNGAIVTREIKGTILPIGIGELLDERLDEATLTIINDVEEKYKPLTEIRIRIAESEEGEEGEDVTNYYFLVARDNATRVFPRPGITRTKHELYLVERTKLLEGIVCPTLTFTNTLADEVASEDLPLVEAYTLMEVAETKPVVGTVYKFVSAQLTGEALDAAKSLYLYLPQKVPSGYIFPSPFAVANGQQITYLAKWNQTDPDVIDEYFRYYQNRITIYKSGQFGTVVAEKIYNRGNTDEERQELLSEPFDLINPLPEGDYFVEYYIVTVANPDSSLPTYTGHTLYYNITVEEGVKASKITITDVVQRTLSCAEPIDSDAVDNPYSNPFSQRFRFNDQQTDQYRQVLAPEFTLTEGTLREQLRTIGGYIHGEPYVDENNVVYFIDLGKEEEAAISGKDVYLSSNWDVNSFCTGIKTYGENLIKSLEFAGGATLEPPAPFTKSLRSEKLYARIDEESCAVEASYPIYSIEKLDCGLRFIQGGAWVIEPVDITRYVYEQTIYNSLSGYEETISGDPLETKSRAIYFARNSKFIKGLTYRQSPDEGTSSALYSEYSIANILAMVSKYSASEIDVILMQRLDLLEFRIEYIPLLPVLLEHGKNFIEPPNPSRNNEHEFTQVYNQSDTVIEAASFGENIKGVAARLGNHELEQTFLLKSVKDIPRVGQLYNGYAISATFSEIMPKNIKCTIALTKDFNRISQYIGVPSHKRLFEISETNAADRRVLIHNTLRISDRIYYGSRKRTGAPLVFTENAVYSIMRMFTESFVSLDAQNNEVENSFPPIGKISNVYTQPLINNGSKILLPVTPIALGNSLTAAFSFADNYSAGSQAAKNTRLAGTQYFQRDTRYTDKYGRIDDLVFHLIDTPSRLISETDSNVARLSHTLPLIKGSVPPVDQRLENDLGFAKYHVQKDNRERLFIASQLEAKTDIEGLFIGSGLMQLCSMHYGNAITPKDIRLYLIFDEAELPRRFDTTYIRTPSNDLYPKYVIYSLSSNNGDGLSTRSFKCAVDEFSTGYDISLGSKAVVPLYYSKGAVGWVLAREPVLTTQTVTAPDGTRFEQTIEEGGEILLYKVGHIDPGETIVPTMHFYITNE